MTKGKKAVTSHIPYRSKDITDWKKRYGLRLLEKGFAIVDICMQLDCSQQMWYEWKKRDKVFASSVAKIEGTVKREQKVGSADLVALLDTMRPYLQRHLTEKEACAETGINYQAWMNIKTQMRKRDDEIAKWFIAEVENAKSKIFALAKNTLTSGIKVNPLLAFNFLKSVQPDIYTDGRKELTGAKGEKLFHAFPMKPGDYEAFLKQASKSGDEEDE